MHQTFTIQQLLENLLHASRCARYGVEKVIKKDIAMLLRSWAQDYETDIKLAHKYICNYKLFSMLWDWNRINRRDHDTSLTLNNNLSSIY